MPFYDFHIHTKFSRCSRKKGRYAYPDVAHRIPALGLDGSGTSDHSHFRGDNAGFLKVQKRQQAALRLENTGLVGLELTILNRRGDLGVHPKYLKMVDYKIIAEHVHKLRPSSEFYRAKAKVRRWIAADYDFHFPKIKRIINDLVTLEINAINRHPKSILAHILALPLGVRILPPVVYERLDDVLEALQSAEVALEVHSKYIKPFNFSNQEADDWKAAGGSNISEFFHHLFRRAKHYDLHYSLGSDAHHLSDILSKQIWRNFIEQINISESRLITPQFFSDSV